MNTPVFKETMFFSKINFIVFIPSLIIALVINSYILSILLFIIVALCFFPLKIYADNSKLVISYFFYKKIINWIDVKYAETINREDLDIFSHYGVKYSLKVGLIFNFETNKLIRLNYLGGKKITFSVKDIELYESVFKTNNIKMIKYKH